MWTRVAGKGLLLLGLLAAGCSGTPPPPPAQSREPAAAPPTAAPPVASARGVDDDGETALEAAVEEMIALQDDLRQAQRRLSERLRLSSSSEERRQMMDEAADPGELARRMLTLARQHPQSTVAFEGLLWILLNTGMGSWPQVQAEALAELQQHQLDNPRLVLRLAEIAQQYSPPAENLLRGLTADHVPRELRGPALFQLAHLLREKAVLSRQFAALDEPARELTTLLRGPEFAQTLQGLDQAAVQAEVEQLLETVVSQYADVEYVEDKLGVMAGPLLFEIRQLAIGQPAPEIVGEDLDGQILRLGEYRGQVVMLDFWGFWCGPCRAQFPHNRELVSRLKGRPFVLLGINSDSDRDEARTLSQQQDLPWRSWFDGSTRGKIGGQWNITTWPTVYLIDHRGVIRFRQVHGAELDAALEQLITEAEQDVDARPKDDTR